MTTTAVLMMVLAWILVIFGILRQFDWRQMAIKWVGNDPRKCVIYESVGDTVLPPVIGKRHKSNRLCYEYKRHGDDCMVFLNKDYPYKYISGRRVIGVQDGRVVASPLGFMTDAELSKYKETQVDIQIQMEANAVLKALSSIKLKATLNILTFIIIAAIALGGYIMYKNGVLGGQRNTSTTPASSPPAATTTIPIPPMTTVP